MRTWTTSWRPAHHYRSDLRLPPAKEARLHGPARGTEQDCFDLHGFFGDHYLDPLAYAYCFGIDFTEEGVNDYLADADQTFAAGDIGSRVVSGSDEYDLRLQVDDVPLTTEDSADLAVATSSCVAGGEVALVGQPLTCASRVENPGPGLPRRASATAALLPGGASAVVDAAAWTIAAPFGAGDSHLCTPAASQAVCDLGSVPVGGTGTAVSLTVTPTSPGLLTERLSVTSASADGDVTNNQAEATIDIFMPVSVDVAPRDSINVINLKRRGAVTVAILSTPTFDATTVDASTVCFGDAEAPGERTVGRRGGPPRGRQSHRRLDSSYTTTYEHGHRHR
jgi:hypothetical protein